MKHQNFEISLLVPDLPKAAEIFPELEKIDKNQRYTNFGPLNQEFENQLAIEISNNNKAQIEADQLCTVSSGTAGLVLAILSLGLNPGSRILIPSYTFPATALAIQMAGHEPVLADVEKNSWQLEPDLISEKIEEGEISAVIPVAAFGSPVDTENWDRFFLDTGVPYIVDAAPAFGCQQIGEHGIYVFSFHATKAFGIGEGGLVVAREKDTIQKCRRLSNFGFSTYIIEKPGLNGKLSEYHAAVGIVQLKRWAKTKARYQAIRKDYYQKLRKLGDLVHFQATGSDEIISPTLVVRLSLEAEKAVTLFSESKIETRRWYTPGLHGHPGFNNLKKLEKGNTCLPVTDYLTKYNIGLPFHTAITPENIETIVDTMEKMQ